MTTFEIPTLTTDRLKLRAFQAEDLDAYAAMQANPEVMRYLVTGRPFTRVEVWRTMATYLGAGRCAATACGRVKKSTTAHLSEAWASSSRSTGRNRRSPTRWTGPIGDKALRPRRRGLPRAASFIRHDNDASKRVSERLGAVHEGAIELRGSAYEHWVHRRAGRDL